LWSWIRGGVPAGELVIDEERLLLVLSNGIGYAPVMYYMAIR
jgi:ferredoxin-NADP reductase